MIVAANHKKDEKNNRLCISPQVRFLTSLDSVADPDVFGPLGSGSFYHQAKLVRKTLIPTVLWLLYDFFSLKNYVNVPSKSNKQKTLLISWRSLTKKQDLDPDPLVRGMDPHQIFMDLHHCLYNWIAKIKNGSTGTIIWGCGMNNYLV
jgi:hypothetical protein